MQDLPGIHVVTLRQVWKDYQQTRKLKPTTVRNYNQRLNMYLSDWLDIPITEITKEMVERRHSEIRGAATANSTFRTLRALLHYAAVKYEDAEGNPILKANPVRRLSELRQWHRDRRRKTLIEPRHLAAWFRAVFSLENMTTRDLLLLILLTGMRRIEALTLRWEQVDLSAGTIRLNTKTMEDVTIPLSRYAWRLLAIRQQGSRSQWVFPGKNKDCHISPGQNAVETVIERSGVKFCLHDLRRTFVTIADELQITPGVIKQLVNHRTDDITEGYTIRSTERLRSASQEICNRILHYAGIKTLNMVQPPTVCEPTHIASPRQTVDRLPQEAVSQQTKNMVPPAQQQITQAYAFSVSQWVLDAVEAVGPATPAEVHAHLSKSGRVRFATIISAIKSLIESGQVVLTDLRPWPDARVSSATSRKS